MIKNYVKLLEHLVCEFEKYWASKVKDSKTHI